MSKWEMVKLGDVCAVQGGYAFKSDQFIKNAVPIIRIGNLNGDTVDLDYNISYDQEFCDSNPAYCIKRGDILIAMSGATVGKIGQYISNLPALLNQRVGLIRTNEKLVFSNYVYHYMKSSMFLGEIKRLSVGCAQPNISAKDIESIFIPLPLLEVQKKIAQTLDAAAELIALRKQQLAELDDLIKSVFYEMFGDPVTNEKGWETCNGSIYSEMITVGVVIKPASYYTDKGVPALRSLNIKPNRVDLANLVYFSEEDSNGALSKSVLCQGDVVVVRTGSTGTAAVIPKELEGVNCIDLIIVRPKKEKLNAHYLAFLLNSESGKKLITSKAVGGIQKHFNIGAIKKIVFPLPPISLQNQFAEIVTKIEEQKALVQKAIDESQYLFDSLMDEYFN